MKILMISHEYPPVGGGGANACMYLAKEYAMHGHHVTIVTVNYQQSMPNEEQNGNIRIIRLNVKRKKKEHCSFQEMFHFLCKAWPAIRKLQGQEKYDVCQIFFGIPSGPLGYLLKKKYHVPYIIRFGGGDIPGFQERFTKVYRVIGPFLKIIWRNADVLVANSRGLKELALDFYDKKDIQIIPNGVDTEVFYPGKRQKHDTIQVLFVSRLIERKGLQYILPEWRQIERKTGKQIHLTIVGDGPYRETLEKITLENHLTDVVSFEGQKDKSEILHYYQEADLFILPSKKEGMPNVVLEAMAVGLPIIMTPCQGSEELVHENGEIVEISQFVDAIIRFCQNDELRDRQGLESRRRAEQEFSWKSTAEAYLQYMNQI